MYETPSPVTYIKATPLRHTADSCARDWGRLLELNQVGNLLVTNEITTNIMQ
jgi:hypothetical protein